MSIIETINTGRGFTITNRAPRASKSVVVVATGDTGLLKANLLGTTTSVSPAARSALTVIATMGVATTVLIFTTACLADSKVLTGLDVADRAVATTIVETTLADTGLLNTDLTSSAVVVVATALAAIIVDTQFIAGTLIIVQTTPAAAQFDADFPGTTVAVGPTAQQAFITLTNLAATTSRIITTAQLAATALTNAPLTAVRVLSTGITAAVGAANLSFGAVIVDAAIPGDTAELYTDLTWVTVVVATTARRTLPLETNLPIHTAIILSTSFRTRVLRTDLPPVTVTIGNTGHANIIETDPLVAGSIAARHHTGGLPAYGARRSNTALVIGFAFTAGPAFGTHVDANREIWIGTIRITAAALNTTVLATDLPFAVPVIGAFNAVPFGADQIAITGVRRPASADARIGSRWPDRGVNRHTGIDGRPISTGRTVG